MKRILAILLIIIPFLGNAQTVSQLKKMLLMQIVSDSIAVTTKDATDITSETVVLGGDILYSNVDTIPDYGVTVNENHDPVRNEFRTFSLESYAWTVEPSSFPYSFSREFSEFDPNTTYYVRAWAYDGTNVYYGEEKTFTTDP